MSLLWYYRPEHLQGGRSPSMHEVSCLASGVQLGCVRVAEQEVVALKHIGAGQLGSNQVRLSPLGFSVSQTLSKLMFQMGE